MKYFGTDGIRGIPNQELSAELAVRIGRAVASLGCKEVLLATDTRISKDMLAYALASGAMSKGMTVYFAGILPTPAIIYSSYLHGTVGVIITASHNPYQDNGIKIILKGRKLTKAEEESVEREIEVPLETGDNDIGRLIPADNIKEEYIEFLKSNIVPSHLKVCIDCANGATVMTAPDIFRLATKDLTVVANKPDGYNINSGVGSTHLDFLRKQVIQNACDIGFSFDGDGDRVLCVDALGNSIDGDRILYLLAGYLKKRNRLKHNKIALTVMSNPGIHKALQKEGIDVFETEVGDKNILKALNEQDLSLGGENSGHIILADCLPTGDGVLTALWILRILEEERCTLANFFKDIELYNDVMVNIRVKNREKVMNFTPLFEKVEEIRRLEDCKIIIRPSGTENLIRVTVMMRDKRKTEYYSSFLCDIIRNI